MNLPEFERPVTLIAPATTNGGVTSDYLNLENVHKVFLLLTFTQAVADETTITIKQAQDASGTGAKAITSTCPLWKIADVSVTDLFTRATDAVSATLANTAKNQKVLFALDPAGLDLANGFSWINVVIGDSSQATNFVCADAVIVPRYGNITAIA